MFILVDKSEYGLVLEYVDLALNSFLEKNFDKLTWDDKYELAFQLASAVLHLHKVDVVHCNLVICLFFLLFNLLYCPIYLDQLIFLTIAFRKYTCSSKEYEDCKL